MSEQPRPSALREAIARIERRAVAAEGARILVALAGPPGVGKSTVAEALRASLNEPAPGRCEIVPMDGFHYDDRVLEVRGHLSRKGAPHTFDVEGLHALLLRLRAEGDDVAVPVFDRELEIARAGARIVEAGTRIVVVEGNYLLLDEPRWSSLRPLFDLALVLEAPLEDIERRLGARWAGLSDVARRAKLDRNDLPNARTVLQHSVEPDLRIANGD